MEPGLQICVSSKTSSSGLSVTHESGYCGTPLQLVIVLSDEAQLSVKPHNGVRFVFHPKGLRPFVENWEAVAARIIQRVHREVAVNPSDETMKCFLEELLSYPAVPSRWRVRDIDDSPPPFLTINYRWNNSRLRFFSTLTTFGSPQDVALQEMRIESFFPADEVTRAALTATP